MHNTSVHLTQKPVPWTPQSPPLYKYTTKEPLNLTHTVTLLYTIRAFCELLSYSMAQLSIVMASLLAYALVALSVAATTVSAQAPAPSPDKGDAFSLPVSSAFIATSLLFSVFALWRH
ncbi:unnamed protein product [Fraxinus pennsylvanica]|uniref:Uncharacterized protein n=1 Tax=Fraxinus pennsylvanica TaxID=56036 RepID=A0AAD2A6T9_9LAMI|nr:unnamed protein product [Fraxinus pennsylvanica]